MGKLCRIIAVQGENGRRVARNATQGLHQWAWIALLPLLLSTVPTRTAVGDEFILRNGDVIYGTVSGFLNGKFTVDVDGKTQVLAVSQIEEWNPGKTGPTPGEQLRQRMEQPLAAEEAVQNASAATVEYSQRKMEGRKLTIEVEKGFRVTALYIRPSHSGFFSLPALHIQGGIQNLTEFSYRGVDFRLQLFNEKWQMIAAQDFYVFRFPPKATRSFAVRVTGRLKGNIRHVRVVRKF